MSTGEGMRMTSGELIFLQNRANNGGYEDDDLPAQKWDWPRNTWSQQRLNHLRAARRRIAEEYPNHPNRTD